MRNIKRSTSLQSVSLPNSVNEDNSSETEYIPPRPYSRHSSRDIKELLEGPVSLDDSAHKNCPDDSRCILVIVSPFSNELTQFKCAHCKKKWAIFYLSRRLQTTCHPTNASCANYTFIMNA